MWKSWKRLFSLKRVNHFPPLGKALLASESLDSSKVWMNRIVVARFGLGAWMLNFALFPSPSHVLFLPYVRLGLALGAGTSILVSVRFLRRIRNASTALMMPVMSKSASIARSQEPRSGYLSKNESPGRMASRRMSGRTSSLTSGKITRTKRCCRGSQCGCRRLPGQALRIRRSAGSHSCEDARRYDGTEHPFAIC